MADGVAGKKDDWIYAINYNRKNFGDQLQPGTWTLQLSGTSCSGSMSSPNECHSVDGSERTSKLMSFTDNSKILTSPEIATMVGRRYDIISGSAGAPWSGYTGLQDRYGFIYPDMGMRSMIR